MNRLRPYILPAMVLIVVAAAPGIGEPGRPPAPQPQVGEVARIQQHLLRAERILLSQLVPGLTRARRANREVQIDRLAQYRNAGVFPHNHDFPDQTIPYFVDEHGTLCAMGWLMAESGRTDIVEAVRTRMNNARVHEIAADPELGPILIAWLDEYGMTVDEAAAVQPAYGPTGSVETVNNRPYGTASVVLLGTAAVGTGLNLANFQSGTQRAAGWVGLLAGAGALALGLTEINGFGDRQTWATVDVVGGSFSVGVAGIGLLTGKRAQVALNDKVTVSPALGPGRDGRSRFGVRLAF